MLIGPQSTAKKREEFAEHIKANPRNYIAQPTLDFSRAPCLVGDSMEPRHVDLRPYVLYGDKVTIVPATAAGATHMRAARIDAQRANLVIEKLLVQPGCLGCAPSWRPMISAAP